jgi:ribose transport system permease protein
MTSASATVPEAQPPVPGVPRDRGFGGLRALGQRIDLFKRIAAVYVMTFVMFGVAIISVGGFASASNVRSILLQIGIAAIVAAGQTFVIIGGGIDLSIPWVMNATAVVAASLTHGHNDALVWVIPLLLGAGVVVGVINGAAITGLGVPPIVMTLAMNTMLIGVTGLAAPTGTDTASPPALTKIVFDRIAGVPSEVPMLIVLAALSTFLLAFTSFGRRLYAAGVSQTVSRLVGIRVAMVITLSYVVSSVLAVVAGLLLLGFTGQAYNGMADEYQFASIATVIVGGASIFGGSGNVIGTIGGVALLTVVTTWLGTLDLSTGPIMIFYGLVVLVSVSVSEIAGSWSRRRKGGATK